ILHWQWQARHHACPTGWCSCNNARSAQFLRTLAYGSHSHPCTNLTRDPAPVIDHLQAHLITEREPDDAVLRVGMTLDIGHRFDGDAVGSHLDCGGERG